MVFHKRTTWDLHGAIIDKSTSCNSGVDGVGLYGNEHVDDSKDKKGEPGDKSEEGDNGKNVPF